MWWSFFALIIGFIMDLALGDPRGIPHPVALIGKLISFLEKTARRISNKNPQKEKLSGALIWLLTASLCFFVPYLVLYLAGLLSPWARLAAESIMCWQILAARSLKTESMKVYRALKQGDAEGARYAVSMIVGRDTERLDNNGIARAAVETVAENTSDGVIAPLFYMVLMGAPMGFLYKGINTMDSMLGYTEPYYKNIGLVPARMDDLANLIPARLSALLMLAAGGICNKLKRIRLKSGGDRRKGFGFECFWFDIKNGFRIFLRDRYKHKSPNSAQTEAACAGMLRIRLAGCAWYHGVLHKKPFIGDPLREIEYDDIKRTCSLMYAASAFGAFIFLALKAVLFLVTV